jgi:hypothetical protein
VSCGNRKASKANTLSKLIAEFLEENKCWQDECCRSGKYDEINGYKKKSIEIAIEMAARADSVSK